MLRLKRKLKIRKPGCNFARDWLQSRTTSSPAQLFQFSLFQFFHPHMEHIERGLV